MPQPESMISTMAFQRSNPVLNVSQDDLFWEAVQRRDRAFDGQFFFGVLTTGVYCLPSCACRLPLRKNVRFFFDRDAAERGGLRPCLRCRPDDPLPTRIQNICERIRSSPTDPWPLDDLAAQAGLSRFHFQRVFKASVGLTPRQFVEASRLNSLKGNLRSRPSVTDAIYESGFGSSSRVYKRVDTRLGMTPSQYREG